ncbi:hypothetical protein [Phenylobacterium sp. SCN 70-31]|mgnify:CR=1 FL=1|uniref:hypothetical protein n=1 Tax=Phenylobacterium sp. SCN 70-31 TaxID=1660129 RepID=UPI0025F1BCC7|nr:hypothetical protein [Phenylobacterium sp. SCN 70-31]
MATLTEMVAAVVVHSSVAALSHFGVALDTPRLERQAPPPSVEQRIVARTPRKLGDRAGRSSPREPTQKGSGAQA